MTVPRLTQDVPRLPQDGPKILPTWGHSSFLLHLLDSPHPEKGVQPPSLGPSGAYIRVQLEAHDDDDNDDGVAL